MNHIVLLGKLCNENENGTQKVAGTMMDNIEKDANVVHQTPDNYEAYITYRIRDNCIEDRSATQKEAGSINTRSKVRPDRNH